MATTLRVTTAGGVTAKGAALTHAELDENFLFTQSGIGTSSHRATRTVQERLGEGWVSVKDALNSSGSQVAGDGVTDDSSGIQRALDAVGTTGGGVVFMPEGTYLVGTTLSIPDFVSLVGAGRDNTIIKLKASANTDIIKRHASYSGYQAGLKHLTIDGNDDNNTAGGVFWAGPDVNRGPTITIEDVLIKQCRPSSGGGNNGAVVITGATWGVMRDVDIFDCANAIGLWHKGSDWLFDGLYMQSNGNGGSFQQCIIQGGAGNTFLAPYFGGNGGLEQVLLWGSSRNTFVGANNDNSAQHAWRLITQGADQSNDNRWIGGQTSSPGQALTNTYNAFQFEDASARNIVVGQTIRNLTATVGKYAINETGTAGSNLFVGCTFGTDFGTSTVNLRSGGGSKVSGSINYNSDYTEGTFTPDLKFGGATTGITYTARTGKYTQIGRMVFCQIGVTLSSKGSASGTAVITGLPLTSAAGSLTNSGGTFVYADTMSIASQPTCYVSANSTTLEMVDWGATGAAVLDDTNFQNTSTFILNFFYYT